MASIYDMIKQKNGTIRYRLNNVFIGAVNVPENVKSILTVDNVVDENGMVLVDQKNEAAKTAPEEEVETLPRVDTKSEDIDITEPSQDPSLIGPVETSEGVGHTTALPDEPSSQDAPSVDDSANESEEDEDTQVEEMLDAIEKTDTSAPETVVETPTKVEKPKRQYTPVPKQPIASAEMFKSKVPQTKPGMGFPRKYGKTVDIFDGETPHTHVKLVGGHMVPLSYESFKTKSEGAITARLKELGFQLIDFNAIEQASETATSNAGNLLMEDQEIDEDIRLG